MSKNIDNFEEYLTPLKALDDDTLEGKFIDGLSDDIKMELGVNLPIGFTRQIEMAHKIEDKSIHQEGNFSPKFGTISPTSTIKTDGAGATHTISVNPSRSGVGFKREGV